ncbi:MAG: transcription termination/antitermination NusG family protein [Hyphomicrobiales bacterium]
MKQTQNFPILRAPCYKRSQRRQFLERFAANENQAAQRAMSNPSIEWYGVLGRSGKEFVAQKVIARAGACAWLPLHTKWRLQNHFSRAKIKIAYPVIAGCLFVGFKAGHEDWWAVRRKAGCVHGVIGIRGYPVAITGARLSAFVARNRIRFGAPNEQRFMRSRHEFKVGDSARIVEGPFEGRVVDVRQIKGGYARVLMMLLGGSREVKLMLDQLEKEEPDGKL